LGGFSARPVALSNKETYIRVVTYSSDVDLDKIKPIQWTAAAEEIEKQRAAAVRDPTQFNVSLRNSARSPNCMVNAL
jgi:hypothetical protein